MFIHHVFFWMSPDATDSDRAQLKQGLASLTSIPSIKQWHIGTPAPTDRPVIEKSYAFSWMLMFDTPEQEAIYQDHPMHLKFVADCQHLWTKVTVYDAV
ncbi:MAG: Dabb family protein [Saprospiraceae bacterium]|nr:Dabb family protein [Saprospiraceae bacterium]